MPIAREGGFLLNHDGHYGTQLGLESHHLAECVAEVDRRGYRAVFGSRDFGFAEPSLDSLAALPPLASAWFWDVRLADVSGLYAQTDLLRLGVHPKRPGIDFAQLPRLESLTLHHNPKDTGLGTLASLRSLYVWHHNTRSRRLDDLSPPSDITHLEIAWANADTLEGLPPLPALVSLELHRCRNLRSLAHVSQVCPNLERLVVTACGRMTEAEAARTVAHLPRLRHAYVQHRIFVSEPHAV